MNFNRDPNEGQLMPEERQILYETILKEKPDFVFEVGTWKGGGSTYYISSALFENKKGILFTIECNKEMYSHAMQLYNKELIYLKSHINFNLGKSLEIYPELLKTIPKLDFVFLDGDNNADQTIKEYLMFEPYLKSDSIIACHDWNILKMEKLKNLISNDRSWSVQISLLGGPTGFALLKRN